MIGSSITALDRIDRAAAARCMLAMTLFWCELNCPAPVLTATELFRMLSWKVYGCSSPAPLNAMPTEEDCASRLFPLRGRRLNRNSNDCAGWTMECAA